MRILCDVDGVLCNFIQGVCDVDGWAQPHHFTKFDMISGLKTQKRVDIVTEAICQKGFCYNLKPYPDSIAFVEGLRRLGSVTFVTSPFDSSHYWHHERLNWLKMVYSVKPEDVIFAHSKQKVYIRGDALIEDRADTASESPIDSYLLDRPWNSGEEGFFLRMQFYNDILEILGAE